MSGTAMPRSTEYPEFAVRWTRDDCRKLEQAGVLDYHYELVEGVILKKMGQNLPHGTTVVNALLWLAGQFGSDFVRTQITVDVSPEDNPTSEPEPDLIILRQSANTIGNRRPQPRDVRLCIEIADTTLRYDLNTKAGLYARAGIPEYWVISLPERKLYIHSDPQQGTYRLRAIYDETETIAPLSASDATISLSSLLPPSGTSLIEEPAPVE